MKIDKLKAKACLVFLIACAMALGAMAQNLTRYTSLSKQFDTYLWMRQYQRKLDNNGVLTQKGQYHPLSIAFYGIMNYDQYMASGDTAAYRQLLNQYAYFTRDTHLTWIDDRRGVGLPYSTTFKDLKAPWYSGMTQGVAISFMLRYYSLTKDESAKDFASKLAYFMLRPAEKGGALSITDEGYTWIEEYPNSKQSKQVLNGFINGLIGLHEYVQFFPNDTLAKRVHDDAYKGMVKSFQIFDTHDWTYYNRNSVGVSNQYMRYQLSELEHLYEIYEDPVLIRQMMIWSQFAYQKFDQELKFYRNPTYQFALRMTKEGRIEPVQDSLFLARAFVKQSTIDIGKQPKPKVLPLEWKRNKRIILSFPKPSLYVILHLDTLSGSPEIEVAGEDQKRLPVPVDMWVEGNSVHVHNCMPFSRLELTLKSKEPKTPLIESLSVHNPDDIFTPKFLFDTLNVNIKLQKGVTYKIDYEAKNLCGLTIFYKYAASNGVALKKAKWLADQYIEDPSRPFTAPADGYYKFFYAFKYLQPNPSFRNFKVEAMN